MLITLTVDGWCVQHRQCQCFFSFVSQVLNKPKFTAACMQDGSTSPVYCCMHQHRVYNGLPRGSKTRLQAHKLALGQATCAALGQLMAAATQASLLRLAHFQHVMRAARTPVPPDCSHNFANFANLPAVQALQVALEGLHPAPAAAQCSRGNPSTPLRRLS
jgi:hypothetical protein